MKSVVFFTAFILFVFVSCKKDYRCQCEQYDGTSTKIVSDTIMHGTEKDVKGVCEYSVTSGGKTTTCTIIE
jgi:hypothetical protein